MTAVDTSFSLTHRLGEVDGQRSHGRAGIIHTPHGEINTPAFIPVGTQATVKTLSPRQLLDTGAQAMLANAYHLYLRPGHELIDAAGGLHRFAAFPGPTYTDSGGFQVMSLGAGFKKVIAMEVTDTDDEATNRNKERLAKVDEEGVTFISHLDGSKHRFTPEISMQIQHGIGADIIFAFDELTTLMNTRGYQEASVARTHRWARRCLVEHNRLTTARVGKPLQSLWGVVQGAQYEDLRRGATRGLVELSQEFDAAGQRGFGGFGIGGALEKHNLKTIVGWVCEELPEDKPRHLLGISEPDDLFRAVAAGADTFDCVAPTRLARHGGAYTRDGRINVSAGKFKRDFTPVCAETGGYPNEHFTRAYIHHLLRAKEQLGATLLTMHNLKFMQDLVANIRKSLIDGTFVDYRAEFLGRYYGAAAADHL